MGLLASHLVSGQTTTGASGAVTVTLSEAVQVTTTVGVPDCSTAKSMIADPAVTVAFRTTMATTATVVVANVACVLTSSCPRRLQDELFNSTRRVLSTPAIYAAFTITPPSGTSADTLIKTINQANAGTFKSNLMTNLASTPFSSTALTISSVGTATKSVSLTGYTKCYVGQGCYFDMYNRDTHFVVNSNTPVTLAECGQRCVDTPGCEAFEHLVSNTQPSCVFWKAGACNIPGGNPPGLIPVVVSALTTCDRGSRSPFNLVSKGQRNSILGIVSAVLCALTIGAMTG